MASKSFNLARVAFNKLRALYPLIGKNVNTGADAVPAVMLAECARCLMDASGNITYSADAGGIPAGQGVGGAVTQITSRTTGVTLNTLTGAITLFSAAGSTTPTTFTVTDSKVGANDVVTASVKSGTDPRAVFVTAVAAGSFKITTYAITGTTTEAPVISFVVQKGAVN